MTGMPSLRRSTLKSVLAVLALLVVVALTWWVSGYDEAGTGAASDSPTTSQTAAATQTGATQTGTNPSEAAAAPTSAAPETTRSSPATTSRRTETTRTQQVPQRVLRTLALIDQGRWPEAADAPGTQGGRTFRNNERLLPATGADGRRLRFQEWDVNPKQAGRGRDAERIVTADDGSAWYTLDHYRSFTRIRGPAG